MAQPPEVEILVHITAPSRAVDDSRYRSLASAYLDFEPAVCQPIVSYPPLSTGDVHISSGSGHDPQVPQQQITSSQDESFHHGFPLTGQSEFPGSPSASFQSVLDNANSPSLLTRSRTRQEQAQAQTEVHPLASKPQASQSSWQSLPSVVEDSIPQNNHVSGIFTSPTRVLEHYLQAFDSPSQPRARNSGASPGEIIAGTPAVRLQSSPGSDGRSHQERSSPPIIPRTPFPVERPKGKGYIYNQSTENPQHEIDSQAEGTKSDSDRTDEEVIDETFISSPAPAIERADSEPLPQRKRPRLSPDSSGPPRPLTRTSSDVGPTTRPSSSGRKRRRRLITVNFEPSHGFQLSDLELWAPEPEVSTSPIEPRHLVTPNLARLAAGFAAGPQGSPFRPRTQTTRGPLRPTERGCWVLDCSGWGVRVRRVAWAYLANYVGSGGAGWGVRCVRDRGFRTLRVYGWGVVAEHLYLLLYLASHGQMRFTDASWVDADGEAVIVVDARKRPC